MKEVITAIAVLFVSLSLSTQTIAETKLGPDQISMVGAVETGSPTTHDPKGAVVSAINGYIGFNYSYGGYFAASGTGAMGVYGSSSGSNGMGIYGTAIAANGWAVYGDATGISGRGVCGYASNTGPGTKYGGYFTSEGQNGIGARGEASGEDGTGLFGRATGTNGNGVVGDGLLYDFYAIGAGVNYGPFTGAHDVKLDEAMPLEVPAGMIVSITGKTVTRKDETGAVSISSTLPTVTLSDIPKDKTVLGAFVSEVPLPGKHWYKPLKGERFGVVNALGEGRVWVTDRNGEIAAGDYITTSDIPGYGQMQDDDLLHSYTVGKAIETVDWNAVTVTLNHNGRIYKAYLIAVVYTGG